MCGIVGFTGVKQAGELLLEALETLEYRGYDSAGMALFQTGSKAVRVIKSVGRVAALRQLWEEAPVESGCGIGHTRWATHGGVCRENAHPHRRGRITLVHNGIIENAGELAEEFELQEKLNSQTDTEVVAALLDHFYREDPYRAIAKTVKRLKGTFALAILFDDIPDTVFAVRNVSPIVVAKTDTGLMLASDVTALGGFSRDYFVLPQYQVVRLSEDALSLQDLEGRPVEPKWQQVHWEQERSQKGGYPFYMEKEIMEQPEAVRDTLALHVREGLPVFEKEGIPDSLFLHYHHICVVACGTAMHAGMVGRRLLEALPGVHVDVEMASEFLYADPQLGPDTLVIAVSQSGETIDTMEALRYAQKKGAGTLAIVNVRGSSIARLAEYVIYTEAGPEIAVASTKAYTTQLAVFYLLAARMGYVRGVYSREETRSRMEELLRMPGILEQVLARKEAIHGVAGQLLHAGDVFMMGRGMDYVLLLEGSLKLKEITYIHSEAYASGEMKHGTIALIGSRTPVVAALTQEKVWAKAVSNIREVQSRGAQLLLLVKEGRPLGDELRPEAIIYLPAAADELMVMPASVALQLLAYFVAADKGLDVDKPRNLAKVVTVE